jgi:hypothetical protein
LVAESFIKVSVAPRKSFLRKKRSEGEPEAANSGSCPNIDSATDPKVALTAVVIW